MVLIVHRKKLAARTVSDLFHYMNILSRPAIPSEALSEISLMYRAVIVLDPETLPEPREFVARLKAYARSVPVFAVSDNLAGFKDLDAFDGHFKFSCLSARLAWYMANYCKKHKLPCLGEYKAAGLNATCDLDTVYYFNDTLTLTKTEAMILRLMIRAYPLPLKPKDVLKYAFKQSRLPEASSVRTHVSSINKKFKALANRKLIVMIPDEGYTLLTPEIVKLKNLSETL